MRRAVGVAACVLAMACSESEPPAGAAKPDATTPPDTLPPVDTAIDSGPPGHDPDANCVKPGTANNEQAIGGYCNPDGGPFCPRPMGELRLCSGGVKDVPPNTWFCTKLCTRDDECGTGAICLANEIGQGCVPFSCAPDAAVADALARADTPSEAATD